MNQRLQVLLFLLIGWSTQVQAARPPVLRPTTPLAGGHQTRFSEPTAHLAATIRYVKESASGSGTGTGTSWANASGDLQAMLRASVSGDQVWVAGGTYKPTTDGNRSIGFELTDGVALYGGFVGTESSPDQRPVYGRRAEKPVETTLSGEIGLPYNVDNSGPVVHCKNAGNTTLLDGFIVSDGYSFGGGSGMLNETSSPTIRNCTFQNNESESGGGGITNDGSRPLLINCVIQNNTALGGAGIFNTNASSPVLTNCLVQSNFSKSYGGGMYSTSRSPVTLINCTFQRNSSPFGAAI